MERCEVRHFVGHGAPGTLAERITQCAGEAVTTLRAGPYLSRPRGMPRIFKACAHHARVMQARARLTMTCGAIVHQGYYR